jgi:leader peptidase (prepilin peptidase) / N-methyltransferase
MLIQGAVLAFLGGLAAGSFVTVVSHRVPRHESIVGPRSRCPGCGTQIAAYDNVPVVSWLLLRGRGRCCGEKISARYPLAEVGLGLAYLATVLAFRDDLVQLLLGLVFVTALMAVTITDLEQRIIPNKILMAATLIGLAIVAVGDPSSLPERAIAAAAAGGLLFAAALLSPSGMGLGDVKLAAVMGFCLGRAVAPALFIALLAGSLVGLAMIAREGASARKKAIPFGPFLAFGALVGLLFGNQLVDWYLGGFF